VRHVRMLGIGLVAIFALSSVLAGPALAKKESEAKVYEKFDECPLGQPAEPGYEALDEGGCNYGEAGPESFFQAGKVTVYFKKTIVLRGGFEQQAEGNNEFKFFGARNGNTISKEAEPGPSLTEGLDAEKLQEPEKKRYEEYLAAGKSTKTTETIELAKPATDIEFGPIELLTERNATAFGFPVMIHISNAFLGKSCYDGNTIEPIDVPFTTGETSPPAPNMPIHGQAGEFVGIGHEGEVLKIGTPAKPTKLVNNSYAAPGVEGCGIEGGADEAVNAGLGLPSPAGTNTTELIGSVYQVGAESYLEHYKPF
jgi:hypothetical protein